MYNVHFAYTSDLFDVNILDALQLYFKLIFDNYLCSSCV